MKLTDSTIQNSDRVVIVGGGPGGAACALALSSMAEKMGKSIEIVVIEGKQFSGEQHHNPCVGILSKPIFSLLEDQLGIPFPYHLTSRKIEGYVLHTANEELMMEDDEDSSVALRRIQFDAFMLDIVKQKGIKVIPARVVDLEFYLDKAVVYTENTSLDCEVVVGAFGMDEGTAALFTRQTGYQPPKALSSVVTKFHPGPEEMKKFGGYIHAFLPAHSRIEFGGISPKANHLTINIAGHAVNMALMRSFLNFPFVIKSLPDLKIAGKYDPNDFNFFKGRFPRSIAKRFFGDRYVMVGDAAGLVRAFKGKGVTSAVQTGIRAAETILTIGISKQAFQTHYLEANQDIIRDLPYGYLMRALTIFLARFQLLDPVLRAATKDSNLRYALFGAISGHIPYRKILRLAFKPHSIFSVLRALF